MDQYNEVAKGQVVRSLKGRDKGQFQVIIDFLDSSHVLVVDGKRRKINSPKKKKIKHLQCTNTILDISNDTNDSHIRKMLNAFVNKEEVH